MAVHEDDFRCKKCGELLEWVDTFDTEGGIQEGYIIENQVWHCNKCNQDFTITQRAEIGENDVDITYFEES